VVNVTARTFLTALLLLNSSTLAAQVAPASSLLAAAERALVNALMLPDPQVFRQLLADDSVFLVPAEARGPDAILDKWSPFLSTREVRLALTIENSMTDESGATGETSGTFAVYGRTNKGMHTTPLGAFSIAWRLVDGEWKIASLTNGSKTGTKTN
jgi:ketosteroid isomerase-like protein